MKKLLFLLTAVVLTAISADTFAQSTGLKPAPGATHSYFITPGNAANTIAWTVYEDDFLTVATDATVATDDAATTNIKWASTVNVGDWYYVQVVETDGSCSNTKVLPVQVTESDFTLTLAATSATACYKNAVSVSIVSNAPVYDHGDAEIAFTVTPGSLAGSSYSGYQFDLDITVPTDYNSTPAFSANVSDFTSGTVTVDDNEAVTITYTIDNTNSYNNGSAADAQDYTATVEISNGVTDNGVSENTTVDDNTDATDVSRPNTSGIQTN